MIRLKNLILESKIGQRLIEAEATTPTTMYEFQDSFPDNIVLPITPNQTAITSFSKISNVNQLTPSLRDFINTLNSAVKAGKLKTGAISINAEADSATAATKIPPKGWDQAQVDFSYSNGASVSNQTLADRRAEAIEMVIRKFVKLPAEVTITRSGNGGGSRKSARVTVPLLTFNKNTNTVVGPNKETVNVNAPKYTPPAYTDAKITLTKCGSPMKANGLCGDPIAYRTKLEPTSGTITVLFNSYYVPDRCIITKFVNNTPSIIHDTGYVSMDPENSQIEFGKLLDELNKGKANGYDGQIKPISNNITVNLDDPNALYFLEVYAPLGPTAWTAELQCQVTGGGGEGSISDQGGEPPLPLPQGTNKNGFTKLWFSKDHTYLDTAPFTTVKLNPAWAGLLKNGKYFNGKEYEYDANKILKRVWDWKNGKKTEGTLDSKV
jgi:hypothetical protein